MTQALNFTPKAIGDLTALAMKCRTQAPIASAGILYLIDKLRKAQVFVLPDFGQLLDRDKPRPELPCSIFRPPFQIVALEYAAAGEAGDSWYTATACSRRISLAWEYTDDLPAPVAAMVGNPLPRGVVIASIAYFDELGTWVPIAGAAHHDYDGEWMERPDGGEFRAELIKAGRINKATAASRALPARIIPLAPELMADVFSAHGPAKAMEALQADLMDEVNAYFDLTCALACRNVSARLNPAPERLNARRVKAGKLPLYGFHVLELAGGSFGEGDADGHRAAPRAHLRRGHIRRLAGDRVTWVNQTMVRGRGFVDKVYAA